MTITRTVLAGLLGCSMLAGCDSDDKKDAEGAGSSTFASDVDALKQDNAKLNAKVGELQAAAAGTATVSVTVGQLQSDLQKITTDLATLQAKASAGETEGGALAGEFKLLQERFDALTTALSSLDKSSATKQQLDMLTTGLAGVKSTLGADIAALEKKAATKEQLDKLASDLAALKTSLTTLSDLQQADHKLTVSATASKISTIDFPAASDRLKATDAARQSFAALLPRLNQTMKDIAAVQAMSSLSADDKAKIADFAKQAASINDDFKTSLAEFDKGTSDARLLTEKVSAALGSGDKETAAKLSAELEALPKTLETLAKKIADTTATLDKRLAPYSGPWEESLEFLRPRSDAPLTKYVNLFIGTSKTDTGGGHSGNVNPGAQTPFGMVSFGPDTRGSGDGWGYGSGGYYYGDSSIQFFSLTHLNGPGCRGQGTVAMLPAESATQSLSSGLSYSHNNESAEPGYYKVKFDNNITVETAATTRTGMMRVTYANATKAYFILNSLLNNSNKSSGVPKDQAGLKVDVDARTISGNAVASKFCDGTWNQPVYFYATFDKPLTSGTADAGSDVATLQFALSDTDKTVQIKIGVSSVSIENAKANLLGDAAKNLKGENTAWSFDDMRKQALDMWNKRLNTIQIDLAKPGEADRLASADLKQAAINNLTKFYTTLYRVFSGPTVYSDLNGDYRSMKQADLKAASGSLPAREVENVSKYRFKIDGKDAGYTTHYSGFSMWDTYRSAAQLVALIAPDEASDMMQSLVADAQQCGAFPHWVDGSEDTIPMQGDHGLNVVAGSYVFGAKKFDTETARKYVIQSTFDPKSACNDKLSVGRNADKPALPDWLQYGYIPTDAVADWKESSATVEMVTSDRSAASFLSRLPTASTDKDQISQLYARSKNWSNIFDTTAGQLKLRAKNKAGVWEDGVFHEGTEPHYIWAFAHDWASLMDKLGGKQAALTRLHSLFALDKANPFGKEPEGGQLNASESGTTYYIGNEPSFQTPWAYNWAGAPKYAQYIIPTIMRKNFSLAAGGLPGNDDMGATSAWYVLATLGLYPVIPSEPGLAVSTPQFKGISMWLGNGKKLRISTDRPAMLGHAAPVAEDARYIKEMKLNGATYQGTWLPLDKIKDGGKLNFDLSTTPTEWGAEWTPPSGPAGDYSKPTANPLPGVQLIQ
ncbi:GH92 family glycosyl hydrolase [Phyllobacterium pellucidum]|nr:GH92 family glycosyl hydrolase [Phyllobacterium pellucidum]